MLPVPGGPNVIGYPVLRTAMQGGMMTRLPMVLDKTTHKDPLQRSSAQHKKAQLRRKELALSGRCPSDC